MSQDLDLESIYAELGARGVVLGAQQSTEKAEFKPDWDYVLVRKDPEVTHTEGGIELPEVSRPPACAGTVLAVGEGHYTDTGVFIPVDLKVGDRIIFSPWAGHEIELNGETLQIIRNEDAFVQVTSPETKVEFLTKRRY